MVAAQVADYLVDGQLELRIAILGPTSQAGIFDWAATPTQSGKRAVPWGNRLFIESRRGDSNPGPHHYE